MIRLSQEDRDLLYVTQLSALDSAPGYAEKLGVSEHSVRRRISKLANAELIYPMPVLNLSRIGYSRYELLFKSVKTSKQNQPELYETLIKHPQTQFLAEVGGEYQAMICVMARSFKELNAYLRFFSEQYEGTFEIQEIMPVYAQTYLGTRSLAPSLERQEPICWTDEDVVVEIDDASRNILHSFCNNRIRSISELARLVKMPPSTVKLRLTKMEEQGLIAGYFNAFDPVDIGMFPFNLMLSFRGVTENVENKLFEICSRRPEVDMIVTYLGAWDFALLCFVESARDLAPLLADIKKEFGAALSSHVTLPQFHTYKWTEFTRALAP
jgi:DNA-binding Lrp family transcriptional regulator